MQNVDYNFYRINKKAMRAMHMLSRTISLGYFDLEQVRFSFTKITFKFY